MQNVIILAVGYSVRALVEACVRSGYATIAVDHFGDADTRRDAKGNWIPLELTETRSLAPASLGALSAVATTAVASGRTLVALLAGGMENLPAVVAQLETFVTVLGPSASQLEILRNPQHWQAAADAAAVNFPARAMLRPADDADRNWLWKPSGSAGGLHIGWQFPADCGAMSGCWQRYVAGQQMGATCIAHPQGTEFVGATASLAAADWPGPTEFIYRGSYGPLSLSSVHQRQIVKLAEYLRQQSGVRGWLQFDFIEDHQGDLWLLECNPRWTAGMEIFSLAEHSQLIDRQLGATDPEMERKAVRLAASHTGCVAKAVVYATQDMELSQAVITRLLAQMQRVEQANSWLANSWLADVPSQPQWVRAGDPIATVRCHCRGAVAGENVLPALRQLQERLLGIIMSPAVPSC